MFRLMYLRCCDIRKKKALNQTHANCLTPSKKKGVNNILNDTGIKKNWQNLNDKQFLKRNQLKKLSTLLSLCNVTLASYTIAMNLVKWCFSRNYYLNT